MLRRSFSGFVAIALLIGMAPILFAADPPLVATDVAQVDRDYWFQGEYVGSIRNACGWCETCGLQVVALGKNEFQAVLLSGGLPGGGWWTGRDRLELTGRRDGDVLLLIGESRRVEIRSSKAQVSAVRSPPAELTSAPLPNPLPGLPGRGDWTVGNASRGSDVAHSLPGVSGRGDRIVAGKSVSHSTPTSGSEQIVPLGEMLRVQRTSQTMGARPPARAVLLFDGSNTDHWKNGRKTDEGLLMIGTETKHPYRKFCMHVEFLLPYMPKARGQGRANSGVYIQSRYEVQVLDSFGLKGEKNECAGLYKFKAPDANMCFPPLVWQTYDIEFQSARFDDQKQKVCPATVSVWHNGMLVQNAVALADKTGGGAAESPVALPTKLQDHGNPVRFRNIWLVDRD